MTRREGISFLEPFLFVLLFFSSFAFSFFLANMTPSSFGEETKEKENGHITATKSSVEMREESDQLDVDKEALSETFTIETYYNAVKFGVKSQVIKILETHREFATTFDEKGFSAVHWAAKKGDVDMLNTLHTFGAPLSVPTVGDAQMYPIHWAASDGKIAAIRFFIQRNQDINVQDANGCTPVAVASQHNHTTCVVFLATNGADLQLCDKNGDNPLHWAAYKGHVELVGFLAYSMKHAIENVDNYGQTALHLSALRGNFDVVEFLVMDYHADVTKKDRNGQTPFDLSVTKEKLKVELFLRSVLFPSFFSYIKSISMKRLMNPRMLTMVLFGSNDKEISAWPWRIVFASNLMGSLLTIYFVLHESLTDLYILHLMNTMCQSLWWICFVMCLLQSPGKVLDTGAEYAQCLDIIRNFEDEKTLPNVCHTCGVRRPLRSKHCKIQRCCIHKFDHFCPFVGNTVGRDNYKFFISLLVMHTICGTLWAITAIYLANRITISWIFLIFMIYSAMWMLMIFGLLNYHTQLILNNMTTNEHINFMKYPYMTNAFGVVDSPFNRKKIFHNLYDGFFPSKKSYYSREEVKKDVVVPASEGHDHGYGGSHVPLMHRHNSS